MLEMLSYTHLPAQVFIHVDCELECFQDNKKSRWVKIRENDYQNFHELLQTSIEEPLLIARAVNFFLKGVSFEVMTEEGKRPSLKEKELVFYARETLRGVCYKVHCDFSISSLQFKYDVF